MTPAGIETATFRFVAQHLNHCATAVPLSVHNLLNNIILLCHILTINLVYHKTQRQCTPWDPIGTATLCTLIDTNLCKPDDGQARPKHVADVSSCRIQLPIVFNSIKFDLWRNAYEDGTHRLFRKVGIKKFRRQEITQKKVHINVTQFNNKNAVHSVGDSLCDKFWIPARTYSSASLSRMSMMSIWVRLSRYTERLQCGTDHTLWLVSRYSVDTYSGCSVVLTTHCG